MYILIKYIHTNTHTHIYIYTHMYILQTSSFLFLLIAQNFKCKVVMRQVHRVLGEVCEL